MKFEVIEQIENPLLKRKEIHATIEGDGATVQKQVLIDRVNAELNADKNLVVIETIKQGYGTKVATAYIKIYETEDALKLAEPSSKKDEKAKPAEGGEAPAAEGEKLVEVPKEEKPAEEVPKEEKAPEVETGEVNTDG